MNKKSPEMVSPISLAFQAFKMNYTNHMYCRCKIKTIKIRDKNIYPDMFTRSNQRKGEVWQ